MPNPLPHRAIPAAIALMFVGGCGLPRYDPAPATLPYPVDSERIAVIDVQVFRSGQHIEIVNSTANTYRDVTVWINRRYALALETLTAGKTVRLNLNDFRDELGEVFNAGGILRTREPTPVRLVELQLPPAAEGEVGGRIALITIRAEAAD